VYGALEHGNVVHNYLTDNDVFKAEAFIKHITEHQQQLRFCGTNAHHQNGIAERAIQTVSNITRAMRLHASMHWKNNVESDLWPMAIFLCMFALQMFSMVVWFRVIVLKTCMFGVALCLCSILSFNKDKSYLDGRLVLKR